LLVEDGAVTTEEAPLGGACHHPVVVLDGQADVEDLRKEKSSKSDERIKKRRCGRSEERNQ